MATKKAPKGAEPMYTVPHEVKEWIERTSSIMSHLQGEVDRLKKENEELRSYRKWAEGRILRSDHQE